MINASPKNKQLPIFGINKNLDLSKKDNEKDTSPWKMFIDGASRNNPGPSGIGVHLIKDHNPVLNKGFFTGIKTNNQAEYLALIVGAILLKDLIKPFDVIEINADSQLLVRQLEGTYKIKNESLQQYAHVARTLLSPFQVKFVHVLREKNSIADALANKGIDQKIVPPKSIITMLKDYEILL